MALTPIIFGDIDLWATGYLRAALIARTEPYTDDVFVDRKIPNPRRDRMVIARRDGGPRLDAVREAPRLGIGVWAMTDQDAIDLALMTSALFCASPDGLPVCKVTQMLGPTPVPDESGQPRLYMTFELITKGRNL